MNKRLICGLVGLGVLVVAAGVVTATVVVRGKGKDALPEAETEAETEEEVKEVEEAVEE